MAEIPLVKELRDQAARETKWVENDSPFNARKKRIEWKAADEIERLLKIEAAARDLSESLDGGFVRCRRCGDQEDTTDLDFAPQLREALRG